MQSNSRAGKFSLMKTLEEIQEKMEHNEVNKEVLMNEKRSQQKNPIHSTKGRSRTLSKIQMLMVESWKSDLQVLPLSMQRV